MDITKITNHIGDDLDKAIAADLTPDERAAIVKIVQQALVDATAHTHKEYKKTAIVCCGPEADLAHKIQEEMDRKQAALISNLSSMR